MELEGPGKSYEGGAILAGVPGWGFAGEYRREFQMEGKTSEMTKRWGKAGYRE